MKYYLILFSIILSGCTSVDKHEDYVDNYYEEEIEEEYSDQEWEQEKRELISDVLTPENEPLTDDAEEEDKKPAFPIVRNAMGGWFAVTDMNCFVRFSPSKKSKKLNIVKKNKKLWVETANGNSKWYTVYTKRSLAYMHKSCFIEEL